MFNIKIHSTYLHSKTKLCTQTIPPIHTADMQIYNSHINSAPVVYIYNSNVAALARVASHDDFNEFSNDHFLVASHRMSGFFFLETPGIYDHLFFRFL